ncbi:hypothetical protein HMN09_00926200 [Mycena chlorophos]|uniref:Uncharacterized protein n=1 Tax=Mycena chlorophos TaxID=658473 RepID=A0A8H6SIQ2_MYCCL|nr:hypothetical protein HMN09_00926200 [Mycena chlorophos]
MFARAASSLFHLRRAALEAEPEEEPSPGEVASKGMDSANNLASNGAPKWVWIPIAILSAALLGFSFYSFYLKMQQRRERKRYRELEEARSESGVQQEEEALVQAKAE